MDLERRRADMNKFGRQQKGYVLALALLLLSVLTAAGLRTGHPAAVEADAGLAGDTEESPSVQTGQKLIALTFDDGPRRSTTTRLLDGLAAPRWRKTRTWCGAWTRKAIRSACTPMTM